jgi:hypothetical protein
MRVDGLLRFTGHGIRKSRPRRMHALRGLVHGKRAPLAAMLGALVLCFFLWETRRGVPVEIVAVRDPQPVMIPVSRPQRWSHWKLDQGEATLRLPSGVQLDVVAPLEIRFLSASHVRVLHGRVTADVGERGKGFVMDTPHTRVVDQGTRFGVDASNAAHTDVVVFKGKVDLYHGGGKAKAATLSHGEAVRVEDSRRMSRIVSLSALGDSDTWLSPESSPGEPIISAVSDNLSGHQPSLRNFYRIVPGGLRDGSHAFADEEDRWENVPPALVGADLIRTFAIDAYNWWLKLTVTVERPSELFVFVDTRNPVPDWVAEDFSDTGERIALDFIPSQTPGRVAKRLEYAIWKRVVHTPGAVTLGAPYPNPPSDRKSFKSNRMYGVAAKPIR